MAVRPTDGRTEARMDGRRVPRLPKACMFAKVIAHRFSNAVLVGFCHCAGAYHHDLPCHRDCFVAVSVSLCHCLAFHCAYCARACHMSLPEAAEGWRPCLRCAALFFSVRPDLLFWVRSRHSTLPLRRMALSSFRWSASRFLQCCVD